MLPGPVAIPQPSQRRFAFFQRILPDMDRDAFIRQLDLKDLPEAFHFLNLLQRAGTFDQAETDEWRRRLLARAESRFVEAESL